MGIWEANIPPTGSDLFVLEVKDQNPDLTSCIPATAAFPPSLPVFNHHFLCLPIFHLPAPIAEVFAFF